MRDLTATWVANTLALLITAVANTAANRRITFGVQGREGLAGDLSAGMVAFAIALLMTTAAADAVHQLAPNASRLVEVAFLTAANVVATVCRYLLLRGWMRGRLQVVTANGA